MPTPIAPLPPLRQTALSLKAIIESVYTDGITAVLKSKLSADGTIAGRFADGSQVYDFSISPKGQIEYNEAEAKGGRSDAYLIGYTIDSGMALKEQKLDAFAHTKRAAKCEKGKRCGGSCVERGLKCRQLLSTEARQSLVQVRSAMGSSLKASASATPSVTSEPNPVDRILSTFTPKEKQTHQEIVEAGQRDPQVRKDVEQVGMSALLLSGKTVNSTLKSGRSVSYEFNPAPLVKSVGLGAGALLVSKAMVESGLPRALGIRVESHSTSSKTAEAIMNNGGELDPNFGGKGAAQVSEAFKKQSENYIHVTGVHPKFKTHDPVFVRSADNKGDLFSAPYKFAGWQERSDPKAAGQFKYKSMEKGKEVKGLASDRQAPPFSPVLNVALRKMQRVTYSGLSETDRTGKSMNEVMPEALRNGLLGKGKTLFVGGTDKYFADNFIPDSDDAAMKSDRPVKVYRNKMSATIAALKKEGLSGIAQDPSRSASGVGLLSIGAALTVVLGREAVSSAKEGFGKGKKRKRRAKRGISLFSSRRDGIEALSDRIRQDKGKPCGKSYIASEMECRIGNESSRLPSINRANRGWIKAAVAMATIVGVPLVTYLAARTHYRSGFAKSAQMATDRAKEIQPEAVNDRQHTIVFGVAGLNSPNAPREVINGEELVSSFSESFSRDEGKDFKTIPIDSAADNVPYAMKGNGLSGIAKAIGTVYWNAMKRGRNPVAVELAAQVMAYADRYPDKPLLMAGYSRGGVAGFEAQEILRRARPDLEHRLQSVSFGTPYGGFMDRFGKSVTISSRQDEMVGALPIRDRKEFPGIGHGDYFESPEIQKYVSDLIYKNAKSSQSKTDSIRQDKGKPCGEGYIAENFECRIGTQSSPQSRALSSSKGSAEGGNLQSTGKETVPPDSSQSQHGKDNWRNAAILGAALIGMPTAGSLAMVAKYRAGFDKSAQEMDDLSEKFESDFKKNAAERTGKPESELTDKDIFAVDRYATGSSKKRTFQVDPSKPNITFTVGGFNDYGEDGTGMAVSLKRVIDQDSVIPLTNKKVQITEEDTWIPMNDLLDDALDPDGKGGTVERGFLARRGATKALKTLLGDEYPEAMADLRGRKTYQAAEPVARIAIRSARDLTMLTKNAVKNGENADAKDIAAQMLAFHKAYPDKPLRIVAHSGGGAAAAEAAEILNRKGVKVKVANIGTPYFGLTRLPKDQLMTITSTKDYMSRLPSQNRVVVSDVTAHNWVGHDGTQGYGGSPEVKAALREFLYGESTQVPKKKSDRTDSLNPSLDRYVAALIKPALREGHSDIRQVISVAPKDGGLTGYFADSKNRPFSFDISASGKLGYKSAVRRDDDGKDKCQKGMPCGSACVPQGDKCELTLGAGSQAIVKLALRTYATEELPTREEIGHAMGLATREFLRNPVKAVRAGFQREKVIRQAVESQTGKPLPTKQAIVTAGVKKMFNPLGKVVRENMQTGSSATLTQAGEKMTAFVEEKMRKQGEDGAVNTAGFTGSIVGGAIAGPLGALAGDLGGAMATRKAVTDYKALQRARASLKDDEAFQSAGKLSQLKKLGAATLSELKSAEMQKKIEDDLTGDVAGWAIGNGAAAALTAARVGIPLKGAAVAIASTPTVVKAHRRIREGENAGKVIRETAQEVATAPVRAVKSGNDRERQARVAASKAIRKFKSGVK